MLILVPTAREAQGLLDGPLPTCETPVATQVGGIAVEAALCGFGPAAAGTLAAIALGRTRAERVALIGVAGTFDARRLPVGGLLAADEVRMHGIGRGEGQAHEGPAATGFPQAPAGAAGEAVIDRLPVGDGQHLDAVRGPLLTVVAAAARPEEAARRREVHPDALAEDMEGFPVALACARLGRSLAILRGISNVVGEPATWALDAGVAAARRGLRAWAGA